MTTPQIAIIATAAVGLSGVLAPTLTGWFDRKHQRALAQAERRHRLRADTYRDISTYLERLRLWVTLTEPILGPAQDAPALDFDEDWIRLGGETSITAPDRVRESLQASAQAFSAFRFAVTDYRRSKEPGWRPDGDENPGSTMQKARETAVAAIETAQTAMRDDLDSL